MLIAYSAISIARTWLEDTYSEVDPRLETLTRAKDAWPSMGGGLSSKS